MKRVMLTWLSLLVARVATATDYDVIIRSGRVVVGSGKRRRFTDLPATSEHDDRLRQRPT